MSVAAELCPACGHVGIERRGFCPRCGSRRVTPATVPGDGIVWSVTEVRRPPSRDDGLPDVYAVGLIVLAAGPRLMARLPTGAAIGDAIRVTRLAIDGDVTTIEES